MPLESGGGGGGCVLAVIVKVVVLLSGWSYTGRGSVVGEKEAETRRQKQGSEKCFLNGREISVCR